MIRYVSILYIKGVFYLFPKNHLLVMLTYIAMLLSSAVIPLALHELRGVDPFTTVIYVNIVAFIIGIIIIYFLLKNDLHEAKELYPLPIQKIILWSLGGLFLAWGGQMFAVVIEMEILDIQPGSENTDLIVRLTEMNIWFLLLPALLGPIVEELVFRKVIFGTLRKRINIHIAAIISSLIFAFFHLDFDHILIYFVMGLVFTFLYVKTNRILIPIIVHMTMNTIAVVAQLLIDPEELDRLREQLSFIFLGGWF